MAELTLRLIVDPVTGRREIVVGYRSDGDALPEEHEEAHRALAEAVAAGAPMGRESAGAAPGTASAAEEEAKEEESA